MAEDFLGDPSDILLKRVGRDCSRSFGFIVGSNLIPCSDCVYIIKPHDPMSHNKILFAIRCISGLNYFPARLERGVGARYIVLSDILQLKIPCSISECFPKQFADYCDAISNQNSKVMVAIENDICSSHPMTNVVVSTVPTVGTK